MEEEFKNTPEALSVRMNEVTKKLNGYRESGLTDEEWSLTSQILWMRATDSLFGDTLKEIGNLGTVDNKIGGEFTLMVEAAGRTACEKGSLEYRMDYEPEDPNFNYSNPQALLEIRLNSDEKHGMPFNEGPERSGAIITLDFLKHPEHIPNDYEKKVIAEFVGRSINIDVVSLAYGGSKSNVALHCTRMQNFAKAGVEILSRRKSNN